MPLFISDLSCALWPPTYQLDTIVWTVILTNLQVGSCFDKVLEIKLLSRRSMQTMVDNAVWLMYYESSSEKATWGCLLKHTNLYNTWATPTGNYLYSHSSYFFLIHTTWVGLSLVHSNSHESLPSLYEWTRLCQQTLAVKGPWPPRIPYWSARSLSLPPSPMWRTAISGSLLSKQLVKSALNSVMS